MASIVYIDPQSYHNLSLYDYGMLNAMEKDEVILFGSYLWDCNAPNAEFKPWFTYNRAKSNIAKGLRYSRTLLRIALYIRKHRDVGVVHIQWLRLWIADFLFLRWLKKRGIKVVFTAHNILPHDTGTTQYNNYCKYYKMVDRICVHTESTKQDLHSQFGIELERIKVIPHGILATDLPEEDIKRRANELRKVYRIHRGMFILASLGVQSYYKGVDILLKLWKADEKLSTDPNVRLMLVGRNAGLDYSVVEACENVIVVDEKVSNLDFQAFLELADVVLLPYRQISQSGVLFSAIARDKPVVVSNVGGLPDPLHIGEVGWNMDAPTEANVKSSLNYLVANKKMVKDMHANSVEFEKVREFYSWHSISARLRKLYYELISEGSQK